MFEIEEGARKTALKIVMYGPAGVGKTSLAAQFPNPLFIDTEDSSLHMDVKRLKKPTTFIELIQMIRWVKQTKPCSTLVIDTADWAEALSEKQVISEMNINSIEDIGYGAGYVKAREKYGSMLDELSDVVNVGINVVLVAHSKVVKFEDPLEMGAYDRYELKLSDRKSAHNSELTKEWSDMVLFLNYKIISVKADENGKTYKGQGGQRKMYTNRQPAFDAKNRFGLPDELPMSYDQLSNIIPDLISVQPTPKQNVQLQEHTTADPFPVSDAPITSTQEEVLKDIEKEPNDYFPQELKDLMKANNVTEDEIRAVMGVRGHYPINTPFQTIAETQPAYFTGGLVANWEGVNKAIEDIRKNPSQVTELWKKVGIENAEEKTQSMNIQTIK